jgi:competence protein ComEC
MKSPLSAHEKDVTNIDLLIAPHHGRKSDRSYDFLDVLKPKLTFFGNANSEHLAYGAWNYRKLPFVTNNQAGCMVVAIENGTMDLHVTNKSFAEACNKGTSYSSRFKAYYVCPIA